MSLEDKDVDTLNNEELDQNTDTNVDTDNTDTGTDSFAPVSLARARRNWLNAASSAVFELDVSNSTNRITCLS